MSSPSSCYVCGEHHVRRWATRELRHRMGDSFEYGECGGCGALQLLDPPDDPARYYPAGYYAFSAPRGGALKRGIRRMRNRLTLAPVARTGRGRGWLAGLLHRIKPHAAGAWLRRTGVHIGSRIVDVGSGSGTLLRDLADAGYTRLVGVDRFIPEEARRSHSFSTVKGTLDDVEGEADLIIFNHSLEHMNDQRETLAGAARRLVPGGWCLIRLPIVPCDAWEEYRENWVQLDPPRHVIIHSVASLGRLVADAGLRVDHVEYDSTELQFAGSEACRAGGSPDSLEGRFSARQLREWRERARRLNASGRGDQVTMYCRLAAHNRTG